MNNRDSKPFLFSILVLFVLTATFARADVAPSNLPTIISSGAIKWVASPVLPRVQVAVMDGDPKKHGLSYTMRLKLPDGYTIPLHWHPDTERLTVLTGVVLFGSGRMMNPAKTTALGPGSYIIIPAGVPHWVTAKGLTIFQVSGVGPFMVNFVK